MHHWPRPRFSGTVTPPAIDHRPSGAEQKFYPLAFSNFLAQWPSLRLLLRKAMQGAKTEDQIDTVNSNDMAVGEEFGQGVQGDAIGGIVEGRNQNEPVGDVEVGIAGG